MKSRMLAVGLTAIVVGAVMGTTPAFAQGGAGDADLGIELTGTTLAEGAAEKFGTLTVTNESPAATTGAVITYDVSGLDTDKVTLNLQGCPFNGATSVDCHIVDESDNPAEILGGETVKFLDLLQAAPGATGDAGTITVSIAHAGTDPNALNDTFTADVAIGESGPDLLVFAPDVHNEAEVNRDTFEYEVLDSPVMAGSEAVVHVFVENHGSLPVAGLEMSITLPEHVTFTTTEPECTHELGDAETTCNYENAPTLLPAGETDPDAPCATEETSCSWYFFPVEVSGDAPAGPLADGIAEAYGLELVEPDLSVLSAPAPAETEELPSTLTEGDRPEIDPTDNVSGFTVFVASETGGEGGGEGNGDDDPLPVTGVPAALLGVAGAAVLALGVGLFLFTRKRRVVLQTPTDG